MVTVADVLRELESAAPGLTELIAGPDDGRVNALSFVEDLHDVEMAPRQALVVLGKSASREAHGYKLDVALRRAGEVSGLVLQAEAARPSLTAVSIAKRRNLPLVRLTRTSDLTDLLTSIMRLLDGGLPLFLERIMRFCRDVDQAEDEGLEAEELLRATDAAERLGISIGPRNPDLDGIPAVVTDPHGQWIQREGSSTAEGSVARLAMWRLAGAVTKRAVEEDRTEQLSLLSAGELLNQLLEAGDHERRPLVRRARDIGIPVDAWHEAVHLEFDNLLTVVGNDQVLAYETAQTLSRVAAQTASQLVGHWTMAPRPGGVLLLHSQSMPSGPDGSRKLRATVGRILEEIHARSGALEVLCGIGGSHEGLHGMAATRAEARAAVQTARLRGAVNEPVFFDAPGIRRLLVEWYSSVTVRQSVEELLAPLAKLGQPSKQDSYRSTLRIYLDNNRSLAKTADQLFLHRNTVAYRINRILEILDVDLDDPHQLLALHLACHAPMVLPHSTTAAQQ